MILAIETSTATASLALLDPSSGECIAERSFTSDRAHNAAIFEPLEELLQRLDGSLNGIVVGTGPGSYSGVRVGIAVANGLAIALEAPVFGWPSFAAVDPAFQEGEALAIGDARRRSFFAAKLNNGVLLEAPTVLDEAGLREQVKAAETASIPIYTMDVKAIAGLESVPQQIPTAANLARSVARLPREERERLASLPLEPIYIREPHITQAKPRTGPGQYRHGPTQEDKQVAERQ